MAIPSTVKLDELFIDIHIALSNMLLQNFPGAWIIPFVVEPKFIADVIVGVDKYVATRNFRCCKFGETKLNELPA